MHTLEAACGVSEEDSVVLCALSTLLRSPDAAWLYRAVNQVELGKGESVTITRASLQSGSASVDVAKRAVQARPGASEGWKALGLAFLQRALSTPHTAPEAPGKALLALKKALTLSPGTPDPETLFNLATVEHLMLRLSASFSHFSLAYQGDKSLVEASEMARVVRMQLIRMRDCVHSGGRYGDIPRLTTGQTQTQTQTQTGGGGNKRQGILDGELVDVAPIEPTIFRILKIISPSTPTILIGRALKRVIVPVVLYFTPKDLPINSVLKLYSAQMGTLHVTFDSSDNPTTEDKNGKEADIPIVFQDEFKEGAIEINGIPLTRDRIQAFGVSFEK